MRISGIFIVALAAAGAAVAQSDFQLKPNDRVVFYGDSITDQRLYTTFVESYVVTRFPTLPVTFVHSGWVATGFRAVAAEISTRASIAMCSRTIRPFLPSCWA